jgi:hypothetical protein
MSFPTKALSIMQPWAWLIVNGWKDIENRSWRTNYRGPLLIHAGLKVDGDAHQELLQGYHPAGAGRVSEPLRLAYQNALMKGERQTGGIVGYAEIDDCVDDSASPWFVGPFGFVMCNGRPLPFMPTRGMQGFFHVEYKA